MDRRAFLGFFLLGGAMSFLGRRAGRILSPIVTLDSAAAAKKAMFWRKV